MSSVPAFQADATTRRVTLDANPGIFGIVGLDPWYTFDANPEYPGELNRALLERMASDMASMGARWTRIEFHAEQTIESGPGPIDYAKHDWFINSVAPKYGLNILAVLGSGLIGDLDPTWNLRYVNDPLDDSGSNRYINLYTERVREIVTRYGNRIGAVEILNEPNASAIISVQTQGLTKAVEPANYGQLIRRSYEIVSEVSPETEVVLGGLLYDDEYGASHAERGRSSELEWLEKVYSSQPVMAYWAEHGRHPFDAVGVHPYFLQPQEVVEYLLEVHALQVRFNDLTGRIWITEIGLPADAPAASSSSGIGTPSDGERTQAGFMSAIYTSVVQKAPFVERVFWFKYEDFPVDGAFTGWGLVRLEGAQDQYGSFSRPWPRKFAFLVYQALARPDYLPVAPVDPPSLRDEDLVYFPETRHTLAGAFLEFWRTAGGEEQFGLPVTEPFEQQGRMVQYLERARFEHYPEYAGEGRDVQLGLLGHFLVDERNLPTDPESIGPNPNQLQFDTTDLTVHGAFKQFWEQNGGLARFGIPLTPEFIEDGVLVQYFERARFEYVPAPDDTGYEVRLGNIGSEVLEIPGWYR